MLDAEGSVVPMMWVVPSGSPNTSSWDPLHGCAKEVSGDGGVVFDLPGLEPVDAEGLAAAQGPAYSLNALDARCWR
jgi:hypothetical protein